MNPDLDYYQEGLILTIQRHIPPLPFGGRYLGSPRTPTVWDSRNDRLAFALDNPPLETEPLPDPQVATLTVVKDRSLRASDGRIVAGPRLLACFYNGDPERECMAQIYDGVNYPLHCGYIGCDVEPREDCTECMDCMTRADLDYSLEAYTYFDLRNRPEFADFLPRYYGSWTFSRPAGRPGQSRPVRMNLLGTVDGETMSNMIANSLSQRDSQRPRPLPKPYDDVEVRLSVLRQLIELDNSLWWNAETWVTDFGPRQVILCEEDDSVKLINFTRARLYSCMRGNDHPNKYANDDIAEPRKPESPIEMYWPFRPSSDNFLRADGPFRYWIPETWIADPELAAQWLVDTFQSSSKYQAPSDFFLNLEYHKKLKEPTLDLVISLRAAQQLDIPVRGGKGERVDTSSHEKVRDARGVYSAFLGGAEKTRRVLVPVVL
ncbi:hypothetical protein QBC40DRAFT_15531 [Triangularia verruculosa]|uniref:Uncharacterized protein n=1 Tax=Triangularia verruculosa TaxID=2587418 RepID=A0AAN7ANZ9_9PEZI|nr:hypothetical protein QBC40DRAFT_15531 [Triangularia verruculosa]